MINVKDYGAVGDGATDDRAAVAAAFAQAKAAFQPLRFPPGTYWIAKYVNVRKALNVRKARRRRR